MSMGNLGARSTMIRLVSAMDRNPGVFPNAEDKRIRQGTAGRPA
jgi:hypothetical protein